MADSTVKSSHPADGDTAFGFTFTGFAGKITACEVSASAATTDVSHIGLAKWAGSSPTGVRLYRKAPLTDSPEVKIDFIATGGALPVVGEKKTFTLTGYFDSTKYDICTQAMCTSASIKAAVGEIIKGSCTFKLSKD
jgi:hypothetical protein